MMSAALGLPIPKFIIVMPSAVAARMLALNPTGSAPHCSQNMST